MQKRLSLLTAAMLALGACGDSPTGPATLSDAPPADLPTAAGPASGFLIVTSAADAGPGTLRAALEAASADAGIRAIRFAPHLPAISIESSLVYSGAQPLTLDGRGGAIDADAADDGLVVDGGASLQLRDLTLRNAGADGVSMSVPASATGTIALELIRVVIEGNGEFGIHVDDQTGSSAASIHLRMADSQVLDNGFAPGIDDKDGIRIDEGGEGDIVAVIQRSTFTGNAADGIELDERGAGDVRTDARHSAFDLNGTQPQNTDDLEDGFDIDEADEGSIYSTFIDVTASDNEDGGIDLDEEGAGDIVMFLNQVTAVGNLDDNIKASEDADVEETPEVGDGSGGIEFRLLNVTATRSGDNGIQLEEFGAGDVNGEMANVYSADNADDGVNIDQQDEGSGTVKLKASTFVDNADEDINIDNVELIIVG